jgi:hypothetical protein
MAGSGRAAGVALLAGAVDAGPASGAGSAGHRNCGRGDSRGARPSAPHRPGPAPRRRVADRRSQRQPLDATVAHSRRTCARRAAGADRYGTRRRSLPGRAGIDRAGRDRVAAATAAPGTRDAGRDRGVNRSDYASTHPYQRGRAAALARHDGEALRTASISGVCHGRRLASRRRTPAARDACRLAGVRPGTGPTWWKCRPTRWDTARFYAALHELDALVSNDRVALPPTSRLAGSTRSAACASATDLPAIRISRKDGGMPLPTSGCAANN